MSWICALIVIILVVLQGVMETFAKQLQTPGRVDEFTMKNFTCLTTIPGDVEGDKSSLVDDRFRWPNRTIPYAFENGYPPYLRQMFYQAIVHISTRTCLRFVSRKNQADFVLVTSSRQGCFAEVGRRGRGQQIVSLPRSCSAVGVFVHELLHASGFFHEHQRTDRDRYVTINWENIEEGKESQFKSYDKDYVTSYGTPYDYFSILHYGRKTFSKNNKNTITPKNPLINIGQVDGMSALDILKVNKMYDC